MLREGYGGRPAVAAWRRKGRSGEAVLMGLRFDASECPWWQGEGAGVNSTSGKSDS
jgi:hypothetical protein